MGQYFDHLLSGDDHIISVRLSVLTPSSLNLFSFFFVVVVSDRCKVTTPVRSLPVLASLSAEHSLAQPDLKESCF